MTRFFSLVFIIIGLSTCKSWSQTKDHHNIVSTVDRGDYIYIPASALQSSVDGIVHQLKLSKKAAPNKRPIEFYWHSVCNDGSYNLIITPEQIYFSSGHDNPNPNYLFWVMSINQNQYESIRKGILNKPPAGFKNTSEYYSGSQTVFYDKFHDLTSLPEGWSDVKINAYCSAQTKKQLDKYFAVINSYIVDLR